MNLNFIVHQFSPQELQHVKKSYCIKDKANQHHLFHLETQLGERVVQFNKNLKHSMMSFQKKSMMNVDSTSKVPSFILKKHKVFPNQPQPLAGLGHFVDEGSFINNKNHDIELSLRKQHRIRNGRVYTSQIYNINPERNNISFITADKKIPKFLNQNNEEKRLQKHRSLKIFKKFNKNKESVKLNEKEYHLKNLQDIRVTIGSDSSSTSSKQKNNKQSISQQDNHIPLFIKNKQKKPQAWSFIISPKNQKNIKSIQELWKKKYIKKVSLDECDSFEDKISIQSKREIQISDFELYQKIGKGAYGDVFLAKEITLGFLCVIKKISKKKIREQNLYQNILRQIKIQTYTNHKHLTPMYGVFDDENYVYIILEYMIDGTLVYEIKKQKKMSQQKTVFYLKQLCQAISYMHNESIIHRDIKPDNIFMHHNYLKLGDMGCSVQTETLRNTVVGCLAYVSPQQLGKKFYDQKIDIWSIGILTYEMLFGKPPFEKQLMKMANDHMELQVLPDLQFPIGHQISHEAHNFIENLLRKDPEQRICIKQALNHPFLTKYHPQQGIQMHQIAVKMHQILNK